MNSLYDVLRAQHAHQLNPVRCAYSTTVHLHRFFEDVVLENNLSALVVESLPLTAKRLPREKARARDLARGGRRTFFFVPPADGLNDLVTAVGDKSVPAPMILNPADEKHFSEHFLVIADHRFSALLACVHENPNTDRRGGDEVVWTFEPDIVYSALEYLMGRVGAEHPYHGAEFESAVRTCVPKAPSIQLTASLTTKLAYLLQEQAARETAVNRIATAIRESLELGVVLQKTVDEVGMALNVSSCALRVEGERPEQTLSYFYLEEDSTEPAHAAAVMSSLTQQSARLREHPEIFTCDGNEDAGESKHAIALVPLTFHERFIGALQVTANHALRVWSENELLMLRTVADQVAVAINHAWLFSQIQLQALTDPLTGCHNRRSFEMQLDRDLAFASRMNQPLSLLMLDLDRFKQLNDTAGHDAGDEALRRLAESFKQVLRRIDSASRFGGDEFALILPSALKEGAKLVAERLRSSIEKIEIEGFGNLTASIGIASYPAHSGTRAELIAAADKALYCAKRLGRNRVCVATLLDETIDPLTAPVASSSSNVETLLL
jgi:diguanylate cyclase (GGDEF)-like protein